MKCGRRTQVAHVASTAERYAHAKTCRKEHENWICRTGSLWIRKPLFLWRTFEFFQPKINKLCPLKSHKNTYFAQLFLGGSDRLRVEQDRSATKNWAKEGIVGLFLRAVAPGCYLKMYAASNSPMVHIFLQSLPFLFYDSKMLKFKFLKSAVVGMAKVTITHVAFCCREFGESSAHNERHSHFHRYKYVESQEMKVRCDEQLIFLKYLGCQDVVRSWSFDPNACAEDDKHHVTVTPNSKKEADEKQHTHYTRSYQDALLSLEKKYYVIRKDWQQ